MEIWYSQPAATQIAAENDMLRIHHVGGEIRYSGRVSSLSQHTLTLILSAMSDYDDFNPRVDRYGEHDFGSIQIYGDYYYFVIENFSDDELKIRQRVMTIMHASEYNCSQ